jgi:hypothetical protein
MLKTYAAKIAQGLIFILSTCILFFDFFKISRKEIQFIIVIACVLLYLLFCIVDIRRGTKTLNENSNKFFDYFEKWYKERGKLCIFCTDLDWMRCNTHDLVSTICGKGSDCTLYLRSDIASSDRQKLGEANVKIVKVDPQGDLPIFTSQRF